MRAWQMQEAKAKFAEVIRRARDEGPQSVSVRGEDAVVVVSNDTFRKLTGGPGEDFATFIRRSPLAGAGLTVRRSRSRGRAVKL